jgi:putative transposase
MGRRLEDEALLERLRVRRYKSSLVQTETCWLACYRYIELDPVGAGMVADPGQYRESSDRANTRPNRRARSRRCLSKAISDSERRKELHESMAWKK